MSYNGLDKLRNVAGRPLDRQLLGAALSEVDWLEVAQAQRNLVRPFLIGDRGSKIVVTAT